MRKKPKTIQYGINKEEGFVISRVGSELALPVLEYADMTPENNFKLSYHMERFLVYDVALEDYTWTKKITVGTKNEHRAFWGMKPLCEK